MKTVELQLITIELENGERGVFVGSPLVTSEIFHATDQINGIWFSNIQEIPTNVTVDELTQEVSRQISACKKLVH